jgi:hypothetical protein
VAVYVPPDWEAYDDEELDRPATRADLEARYPGARGLFEAIAAQGDRVDLQLLTVDPSGRGSPSIPATVSVVEVEPRIPRIGLELGADLVLDGLDEALDIQSEPETERIETPVGDAIRFTFDHLVTDEATGEAFVSEVEGALVTSDEASFLVLRTTDAGVDDGTVPSLDDVLGTLREGG